MSALCNLSSRNEENSLQPTQKELLGPCLIVSPSHEALLPNVPPENVVAMAEAALE
jgi:hypothetical protein